MNTYLDTDVLIDLQRSIPAALAWLRQTPAAVATIPGIVALEFLIGSRSKRELDSSLSFLRSFDVQDPDESDFALARKLVAQHRLSTGLGLGDFLIAAQSLNRQATLYSFNLKHYAAVPDLDVRAPYAR